MIGDRSVLLVIDNCEHVLDGCIDLAKALLHACPELRILATSRESMGITGEVVWPVPPLSLPESRRRLDPEELLGYESIRLFVARVIAVKPTFTLTAANAESVVQITERLDGLPLALELAAARAKVLSVQEIAARLDSSLQILDGGPKAALARHRTMPATIVRMGASGFMLKEASGDELLTAIEVVRRGDTYLPSGLMKEIVTLMVGTTDPSRVELTSQQREVLRLIVRGQRAKEIAVTLQISTRAVESTKSKIMQLLNVHSTAELVRYTIEHRLVTL